MIVALHSQMRSLFATSATPVDPDGFEPWPAANVNTTGFDPNDGTANAMRFWSEGRSPALIRPIRNMPIYISVKDEREDLTPGVDEYDWYLSQRTDDPSVQMLSFTQKPRTGGFTYSGTGILALTSYGVTQLGLASATADLDEQTRRILFKNVFVYVQQKSDNLIQCVNILNYSEGKLTW